MRVKIETRYDRGIVVKMTVALEGGYGFVSSPTVADAADYARHMQEASAAWERSNADRRASERAAVTPPGRQF